MSEYEPVSFPPPLVRLSRVGVDVDRSVTVSDGCIWFLHPDEDTETKRRDVRLIQTSDQEKEEDEAGLMRLYGGFHTGPVLRCPGPVLF